MKHVSTEEAWGVLRRHGYQNQFVGDWVQVHPGKVLVGRAVTSVFLPHRPDFHDLVEEKGKEEGRICRKHNLQELSISKSVLAIGQ